MLWLPRDQVRLSMACRLFRLTNVGVCASGPSWLRPVMVVVPNRELGMNCRLESNDRFSTFCVFSYAWFHATLASLRSRGDTIHLCSPTTDCDFVRVSVVQNGIGCISSTNALSNEYFSDTDCAFVRLWSTLPTARFSWVGATTCWMYCPEAPFCGPFASGYRSR